MKYYNKIRSYEQVKFLQAKFRHIYHNWKRIHTVIAFFLLCFSILIIKLFSYTIFDGEKYQALADKQQIGEFTVPVNRGTIYSSMEREKGKLDAASYFATSINLYDLAIDPTDVREGHKVGSKENLQKYLTNILYREFCEKKTSRECEENVLQFLQVLKVEKYSTDAVFIQGLISKKLAQKLQRTKVTSVLIDREFTNDQIMKLQVAKIPGVYPKEKTVYLNPEEFSSNMVEKVASILDMSKQSIEFLTKKRDLRYVPIIRKLSVDIGEEIKNYIKEEKDAVNRGIVAREDSISSFIIMEPNPVRYYPEKTIASQVIGFVDNEGIGHYGIEGYFNEKLKGNNGKIVAKKDVYGRIIDPISLEQNNLISEGIKIVTTIDRNVQKKVEEILEVGVKRYRATKGTIIITEPYTGRIISMANYPSFDVNKYSEVYKIEKVTQDKYPNPSIDLLGYPLFVKDSKEGKEFIYNDKKILLREATTEEVDDRVLVKYKYTNDFGAGVYQNDSITGLYEPGSIMKSFIVAMGLDSGEINENTKYKDTGVVKVGQFEIKNESDKDCSGYHTFQNALNFSCNVGMVRIIQRVGKPLSYEYFQELGFGEKTGIELDGELARELRPWEKWTVSNFLTRSYGLGMVATPLQIAAGYNALANGGIYIKPKIIERIEYPNGRVVQYKTEKKRRVFKESTSKRITNMLQQGTELGFAKTGAVPGYNIAGKTGTAMINEKGRYRSGPGWTNASYAGYGPVEDPKFVIIVKLQRPKQNTYGSQTSGKIFKEVATYLFDYYKIPKSKEVVEEK